jgi:hypothetical protein
LKGDMGHGVTSEFVEIVENFGDVGNKLNFAAM